MILEFEFPVFYNNHLIAINSHVNSTQCDLDKRSYRIRIWKFGAELSWLIESPFNRNNDVDDWDEVYEKYEKSWYLPWPKFNLFKKPPQ